MKIIIQLLFYKLLVSKKYQDVNEIGLCYFKKNNNKFFFDLKSYIFSQIKNCGISNIEIIKKDTFNPKNNFLRMIIISLKSC